MLDSFHSQDRGFLKREDWREYRRFAFRDDVMKLTVGVVLGASFNKLVNSVSGDLVMPLLSLLTAQAGEGWREWKVSVADGLELRLGQVAGSVLDFLVVSLVLYILYVKVVGRLKREAPQPAQAQRQCLMCLEMIRPEATRCRYCGGNPDGTKGRTRGKDKGEAARGGDEEGSDGPRGKDRNGASDAGKPDRGADGGRVVPKPGRKGRGRGNARDGR